MSGYSLEWQGRRFACTLRTVLVAAYKHLCGEQRAEMISEHPGGSEVMCVGSGGAVELTVLV